MKEAGLPEPIFDTRGFFTVTFMKRVKGNNGSLDDQLNDPLNCQNKPLNRGNNPINRSNGTLNNLNDTINDTIKGHEAKNIELLKNKADLSGVQIAENLNLSLSNVMWAIKRLVSQSLIEYRGSKKTGGYYIKDI